MRLVLCIKDVGVTRRKVGHGGRLEFWLVVWWKESLQVTPQMGSLFLLLEEGRWESVWTAQGSRSMRA